MFEPPSGIDLTPNKVVHNKFQPGLGGGYGGQIAIVVVYRGDRELKEGVPVSEVPQGQTAKVPQRTHRMGEDGQTGLQRHQGHRAIQEVDYRAYRRRV